MAAPIARPGEGEHGGHAGDHQHADERRQEQGIGDRLVNGLERTDEGPVIGRAQTGHDGVGVQAEHTGHEAHGHRGHNQYRTSKQSQPRLFRLLGVVAHGHGVSEIATLRRSIVRKLRSMFLRLGSPEPAPRTDGARDSRA
jgi:hypothetical protein